MATNVNHVRNPDFALGKGSPRHWAFALNPRFCEVHRTGPAPEGPAALTLVPLRPAPAFVWQTLRCKPDAYYRVEALVRCELVPAGDSPGLVLALEFTLPEENQIMRLESPALLDAPEAVSVRTYFHAPAGCKEARMGVGIRGAVGLAEIREVRFIRILEPDEMSHPLAIQAPYSPAAEPVRSVCVCSDEAPDRPLCAMLAVAMGESQVSVVSSGDLQLTKAAEGLLLPDPEPPAALRSLRSLLELSEKRLVVISLPAFAKLAPGLKLRRIEQPDDPIHAKVVFANEATRGFTLHDSFAYAWPGKTASSFVQNQFRDNDDFQRFCKRQGFITLLASHCDKDNTSDQPICLFRATQHGGLYVLDLNPIEAAASTMGEPALAAHLLLSILHRWPSPAGQFAVPVRTEVQLRDMIREAPNRWDHIYVHEEDAPPEEITHQIVTIGREDEMYGLPAAPKPVILVRSGLSGGDAPSVYGALAWFRQFLLHSGHRASYSAAVASKFRLAWVPSAAAWEARDGWSASGTLPAIPTEVESDGGQVAALVDVCSGRKDETRIVFAKPSNMFRRMETWLPRLVAAFSAGEFPAISCALGHVWQKLHHELTVAAEPDLFAEPIHAEVLAQGSEVVRIELPSFEADYVANSIHHTHLAVTTLEQVIGLLYGLIAVNRTRQPVLLDGVGTVPPGESIILDHEPATLAKQVIRTG